jgi:hypothetical protein
MVGAVAVTAMVTTGRKAMGSRSGANPEQGEAGITAGQALSEGPGMPPSMNRVTANFVQKIATGIFGASLSADQQYIAGTAWHLIYGGFWGMVYGLLRSSLSVPSAVLGPVNGLVVWAVGPAWLVPKMKLMLPPGKQKPYITAMVIGVHVAYGSLVALVFGQLRSGD